MEPDQFDELMEAIENIQGRLENLTVIINNQHNIAKAIIDQQSQLEKIKSQLDKLTQ